MPQTSRKPSVLLLMIVTLTAVLALLPRSIPGATAFSLITGSQRHNTRSNPLSTVTLHKMTSEDETPSAKRKRKRKVEEASVSKPSVQLQPRDDKPVQMEIMDVRQVMGGGPAPSSLSSATSTQSVSTTRSSGGSSTASSPAQPSSTAAGSSTSFTSASSIDDSLQQLLEDAKRMKQEEEPKAEESNVKVTIRNALSTLVTADFFVVCGFLLWFLVGIFCSSVLKDDTIQIAFNSNFQAFVQPALGILMLGTVAGNFIKEEDEDERE